MADSNRLAPGWGHMPFAEIFGSLSDIGYRGYLTAEILPLPDPDSAAQQAIRFLTRELKHAHDTSKPSQGLNRGSDRL